MSELYFLHTVVLGDSEALLRSPLALPKASADRTPYPYHLEQLRIGVQSKI